MVIYASFGILVLCICFIQAIEVCQLPSPLQSSRWNYTDNSRELILAFGTSTMSGFKYKFAGEYIESYDCISNTNNVYVFKSQDTFSKRGVANRVYACMKMTMVSSNLFYFYLLAETDTSILPNPERLYIENDGLSDDFPTCDYCQYTTSPPDDDFRILRRSGQSSDDLSGNVSLCLPCNANCTSTPVSCGTLPVVSHTANDTTGTDYSDAITYTCLSGYEKSSGNLVRTCQADKTWSGSPHVCYAVQSISNEQVSMITAGTIAGSILLFGIVFMVVVSCLICGVKRRNKVRGLNSKTRSRKTQSECL